jgi:hypothetical protein
MDLQDLTTEYVKKATRIDRPVNKQQTANDNYFVSRLRHVIRESKSPMQMQLVKLDQCHLQLIV